MIPQGTSLIDTSYFDNLTAQVNAIQGGNACAELQKIINDAGASIEAELTAIRDQIAKILPLISLPTSLGSVIAWISSFAAPMIAAYANLLATEAAVLAAVGRLESAVAAAAGRLVSCSITLPSIT